jgi:SWIM zinc finger
MNGYLTDSTLTEVGDGRRLDLATALALTPAGLVENPVFFTGFLPRPDIACAGLLAVADVAASRYADAGLAKRLLNLDPVVTAGGDRLRFESFSACNSVHARFDLLPDGLGTSEVGFGTTNIDVNQPLRAALASVDRAETLHLSVGSDELRTSSLSGGTHVERRVKLQDRWVRGLAEVPALMAGMSPVGELRGTAILRFLASLPRLAPPGPSLHVITTPAGWRTIGTPVVGSFPLPGASRVRGFDRIARFATGLQVHAGDVGATAWVFEVPGGRLTLALSPDPYRGFSGEGSLLMQLTRNDASTAGQKLLAALGWEPQVDADALRRRTGLDAGQVAGGLAWLSASGRLGYDLTDAAWFHRELPVDAEKVIRRHPRLVSARSLVAEDGVRDLGPGRWAVKAGNPWREHYLVTVAPDRLVCECPWEADHAGMRGPCKHVLAVVIGLRGAVAEQR